MQYVSSSIFVIEKRAYSLERLPQKYALYTRKNDERMTPE